MEKVELTGERAVVRLLPASFAPQVLNYFEENKSHHAISNPVLPKDFLTESFWKNRLETANEEFDRDQSIRLFVSSKSDLTRVIGSVNFTQIFRGPFQACYLGYSIAKSHEGQGLMFESLKLAIQFVFEARHLHRVMANYLPENKRSGNVLERLGFRVDGKSADYLWINGTWREHTLTSLTNPNWTPRNEDQELFNISDK